MNSQAPSGIIDGVRMWPASVVVLLLISGCAAPGNRPAATSPETSVPTAAAVTADPRIGAVFLGGGTLHVCTGSVVHSRTADLVLTAAHCLADGIAAAFVPGLTESDSPAPADMWRVDTVYLDPRWLSTQDPRADFAIARVGRDSGGPIEHVVGSALTLGTAPRTGTAVTITGYPLGVGGGPVGCRVPVELADPFPAVHCGGLADGTSGAPWVAGNTIAGITGGRDGGGCDGDTSYSAPFDDQVANLLARAEAGGPGDAAPTAFGADC